MRSIFSFAAVLALVALPSFGVINVKLTADNSRVWFGETTTIRILAKADESGLLSLDGDVLYDGAQGLAGPWNLQGTAGTLAWNPQFHGMASSNGSGSGGGWSGLWCSQPSFGQFTSDPSFAKSGYVEVASYQIKNIVGGDGFVFLRFQPGVNCQETGGQTTVNTDSRLMINVGVPEPTALGMLLLGGLFVRHRRR